MDRNIDIILSCYNGSEYIDALINSLINQTYQSWRILLRDDGSSDDTAYILAKYASLMPNKFHLIEGGRNIGIVKSFSLLLQHSSSDYIMFCDQDDVWLPDKIQVTLIKMIELENSYGPKIPILIHTDLAVTNDKLNIISNSFRKFQKIDPLYTNDINRLVVQNSITGCTMMINKALKHIALPISDNAIMHDWWIGMVAANFGKIGFVDKTTILYRQHSENDTGAKQYGFCYIINKFNNFEEMWQSYTKSRLQAISFLEAYNDKLNVNSIQIIKDYIDLANVGSLQKIKLIFKRRFFKIGFCRNIGFVLSILYYKT